MGNGDSALAEAGTSMPRTRSGLVRGPVAELGLRSANGAKGTPRKRVLHGTMIPFDEWVEIDSIIEGHFLECFLPGSLDKTFSEGRERMRCILHHGKELLGRMVIGTISDLHADEKAGYYEVDLYDDLPGILIEGLEEGQYGTSVYYELVQPDYRPRPGKSSHNPKGLDELRVAEAKVIEFGPTPFGIYEGASAALRSMTDDVVVARLAEDPAKLAAIAKRAGVELGERSAEPQAIAAFTSGTATSTSGSPVAVRVAEPEPPRARRYERACQFVETSIWLIHPAALSTILQVIGERASGYRPSAEEIAARLGERERAQRDDPEPAEGPVRVIPINGTLVPHSGMFADVSEAGRAVEDIRSELREAVGSEDVKAVLLEVDSPGGSAELIPELASEMREMRGEKPIWAIANTFAASGAYYLASQADELIVTPSGYVGSIGAYTIHDDLSEKLAAEGISKSLIYAGEYKVEGNPFEPLSDEAREYRQEQIDEIYKLFVADVAKGRGVSVKDVQADFGQGRMVTASKAVERGMADRVATLDQTMTALERQLKSGSAKRAAALPGEEPEPSEATTPAGGSRRTRPSQLKGKEQPRWQLPQKTRRVT